MDGVAVGPLPASFSKWGKEEHADRPITVCSIVFRLIPDDEQRATLFVLIRVENKGHILPQPGIRSQSIVGRLIPVAGRNAFVAIVAQVGRNEVVSRRGVIREIGCQLVVRPDVLDTIGRLRVQSVVDIVEIHKSEVLDI